MKNKKSESKTLKESSKKKKVIQNNTEDLDYTKIPIADVGYYSWREKPASEAYLRTFCAHLLEWARTSPDADDIEEYFDQHHIWYDTAWRWRNKHEFVDQAVKQALRLIGTRRAKGALRKQLSESYVLKTQHMFKPEWHDTVNIYHNDMKKDLAESGSRFVIHESPIQISGKVPDLIEDDE
jgi:hypothetical protein